MVDFKKLMERTPEECAADQERMREEFERNCAVKIALVVEQIGRARGAAYLSQRDRQFLDDLQRKSTDCAHGSVPGIRLLDLTAGQRHYLEDLAARGPAPTRSAAARPEQYAEAAHSSVSGRFLERMAVLSGARGRPAGAQRCEEQDEDGPASPRPGLR